MTNDAILRCPDYAVSGRAPSAVKPSTASSRVRIWAILSARRVSRKSGSPWLSSPRSKPMFACSTLVSQRDQTHHMLPGGVHDATP
jgi:hypothetical protein